MISSALKPLGYLPFFGVSNAEIRSADRKLWVLSGVKKVVQCHAILAAITSVGSALGAAFSAPATSRIAHSSSNMVESLMMFPYAVLENCGRAFSYADIAGLALVISAISAVAVLAINYMQNRILDDIRQKNWGLLPSSLAEYR